MIVPSARLATPLARQNLSRGVIKSTSSATMLRASQRRMASATTKAAIKQTKSDAPWAIGSVVVFGSMFVYVTSPPKGGKKGHGHDDSHKEKSESSSEDDDDSGDESEATEDDGEEITKYDNVKKIQDKPGDSGPKGGQALGERSLTAEEGAHKQKTSKSASDLGKPDDITFKTGVAASKEGHGKGENSHISDPKKVVADAHAKRQSNKDEAAAAKSEKSKDDEGSEEDEVKKVHESPQAADANAQNSENDKEDEESQAVHDSPNAKKANEINEAEGSNKKD
ncbi:hypothetical protein CBS101457_002325 [Exobasidium rhododendri]|nr:hypothetical protein CBS101457_002325 [Exobasidium rhododendri]